MAKGNGVSIAYSGVHTAYQQALAAAEEQMLNQFYTSLAPGVGFYGHMVEAATGERRLISRSARRIPVRSLKENPFTLLKQAIASKLKLCAPDDWYAANDAFDKWASRGLKKNPPQVFVGFETCALHCLKAAKELGATAVLESPQAHPDFLRNLLKQGEDRLGLTSIKPATHACMDDRRDQEFELADRFLVYSDIHAKSFIEAGFSASKLHTVPMWADPTIWQPAPASPPASIKRKLRLLFVGSINLRKGIPWLVEAMELLKGNVELTLIGSVDEQIRPWLSKYDQYFTHIPGQPRYKLLEHYQNADLFILPSLLDTFGFVAMEAMMSGLPAIVSENSGCPVPAASWRIPVMDSHAIAKAVQEYDDDRELLRKRSAQATEFAGNYTESHYRQNIKRFYRQFFAA